MATEGLRDYDAGELVGVPTTLEQQLENRANFVGESGKLFLVRCMACGSPPRGRENYMAAAATGQCAWCGWSG
jgi:hypothetical protein